jgi:ABC-type nitrate/sulfonate/bicarbonate transport system substrate-binding protein
MTEMSNSNTTKILVAAAIVAVVVVGAAIVRHRHHQNAAVKTGPDVLRLSQTIADGALIADELGLFAKHDIRIEWKGKMAHGPATIVALAGGELDAAGSVSTAMILARAHGSKIKIIASSTLSPKEKPLFRYMVKDGSSVGANPKDFIGKTVVAAPTTITWYPLAVWLKRGGVDPAKVEFIQLPSPLATEQALRSGKVDVIGASEATPPGSKLLAEGGVHFLPGLSDAEILGIEQIGGWAVREDYLESHPDVIKRFIQTLKEGYAWSNAHPDSAAAILTRRNGVPAEYAKYQRTWRPVPENALVDSTSIRKWVAILEEFGQIPTGSIKPEDVYTNSYNTAAGTR